MSDVADFGSNEHVSVPDQVHYRQFDDELVLLDLERGHYFALNDVGARMWLGLVSGMTPAAVAATLTADFEVEEGVLLSDCVALVNDLMAHGLLRRRDP